MKPGSADVFLNYPGSRLIAQVPQGTPFPNSISTGKLTGLAPRSASRPIVTSSGFTLFHGPSPSGSLPLPRIPGRVTGSWPAHSTPPRKRSPRSGSPCLRELARRPPEPSQAGGKNEGSLSGLSRFSTTTLSPPVSQQASVSATTTKGGPVLPPKRGGMDGKQEEFHEGDRPERLTAPARPPPNHPRIPT